MSYDSWKLATPPEYEEIDDAEQPDNRKIITNHDYPPIPIRTMDWSAHFDDYDAEWLGEETGWVSDHPVGHGRTEAEAIADLLDKVSS